MSEKTKQTLIQEVKRLKLNKDDILIISKKFGWENAMVLREMFNHVRIVLCDDINEIRLFTPEQKEIIKQWLN